MGAQYDSVSKYKLWLCVNCRTRANVEKLLAVFGSPENVFANLKSLSGLERSVVTDGVRQALMKSSPEALCNKVGEKALRCGIQLVFYDDVHYPANLSACSDAPALLYIRGRMFPEKFSAVGMVGTRRYTDHGAELAEAFAYRIAAAGITVVSGMALGIDTVSAISAMRALCAEYPTIAVLGSGVDLPTPRENRRVYEKITENGTVVSQFFPGTAPTRYTYPMRNRVIAGISDVMLVIEAGEKSGALITANAAKSYGRPVYAVPARITDVSFEGSNTLLMEGNAMHANDADAFVERIIDKGEVSIFRKGRVLVNADNRDIQLDRPDMPLVRIEADIPFVGCDTEDAETNISETLDETDKSIYNALCESDKSFDELKLITGLCADELNLRLTTLELRGCVAQRMGRVYTAV